jgi:hypothetical protein
MSVERSGQAIDVETLKGQLATGRARGFDEGRQLFTDGTSRMNREVQVRICEGLGGNSPGLLGTPAWITCTIPRNPRVVVCGSSHAFRTLSSGSRFHQQPR